MVALTSANACCVVYGDSSEIISLLEHDPNNIFIIGQGTHFRSKKSRDLIVCNNCKFYSKKFAKSTFGT